MYSSDLEKLFSVQNLRIDELMISKKYISPAQKLERKQLKYVMKLRELPFLTTLCMQVGVR